MAIDKNKLLPSSGGGLVKTKSSVPTATLVPYKGKMGSFDLPKMDEGDQKESTLEKDVEIIREKTEKIHAILKKTVKINLKKIQLEQRKREDQKRQTRENELEKKKEKKKEERSSIPIPSIGIFDRLKNFLGSVFLGWLGVRLLKHLPKIYEFIKFIAPVAKFIGNFIEGLLDKLVTFIDLGYTIVDKIETTIDNIFGDEGVKKFKEFQSLFTKFMNLAIIAGMATMGGEDPLRNRKFDGPQKVGFDRSGRRVSTRAQQKYLSRYGDKKFAERFGNKNARRLDKLARQRSGIDGRISRAADPLARVVQKGVTKVAGKTAGRIAGKIPIVGPLIDFGIRAFVFKEPLGKAAAAAVGAGVGQAIGTWLGGVVGGLAGSVVPIVGNLLGAAGGATLGGLIGGVIGDQIGASLYNVIAGSEKSGAVNDIEAKARGGIVGDKDLELEREIARRAKIFQFTPSFSEPEPKKDKEADLKTIFGSLERGGPFDIIRNSVKSLRDRNSSIFSKIMSLGVGLLTGQKIDSRAIRDVTKNLVTFFDAALPAPMQLLRSLLQKLESGGMVVETIQERQKKVVDISRQVERTLSRDINKQSQKVFNSIKSTSASVTKRDYFDRLRQTRTSPGSVQPAPGSSPPPGGGGTPTPTGKTIAGTSSLRGLTGNTGSAQAAQGRGASVSVPYSPFAKGASANITSGKGMRDLGRGPKPHNGIDVGAAAGTPMYAYLDGKVTHVNKRLGGSADGGYGYWIVWKDDVHGAYHFFGHLDRPPGLKPGDTFKAGALLANVGGSGHGSLTTYAPHLHWEISKSAPASNGQFSSYVDPIQWVNTYGAKKAPPKKAQTAPPAEPKTDPKGLQAKASYEQDGLHIVMIEKEVQVAMPVLVPSAPKRSRLPMEKIRRQISLA
jgi:murein DD-endopeptidase MepM/ murein hydrolase activator NlpD